MNEEWYNGASRGKIGAEVVSRFHSTLLLGYLLISSSQYTDYSTWLGRILDGYKPHIDSSDRTLSQFLLDIPYLPPSVFTLLAELCVNQATYGIMRPLLKIHSESIVLQNYSGVRSSKRASNSQAAGTG